VQPVFTSLNIPFMSKAKYFKTEPQLGDIIHEQVLKSMKKAGERERELAIENGDILPDGTPYITVIGDGQWGKRSYGNNYKAMVGSVSTYR